MTFILPSKSYTIAFTGPRPKKLYGYQREPYIRLKQALARYLTTEHPNAIRYISGGAQGFDQLAFWVIEELKQSKPNLINDVYVPFPGQELRWMESGVFGQQEYRKMLQAGDHIHYVTKQHPENYQTTVQALFRRNEAMIRSCDILLACYPFEHDFRTEKGGTAGAIRYAYGRRPIIQLDPNTFQFRTIA